MEPQLISVCLKRSFICDIGPFLQLTLTCVLVIRLQSHLPSLALMFTFCQFFPFDVSFILEWLLLWLYHQMSLKTSTQFWYKYTETYRFYKSVSILGELLVKFHRWDLDLFFFN